MIKRAPRSMVRHSASLVAGLIALLWVVPLVMVITVAMKSEEEFGQSGFFGIGGSLGSLADNIRQAADLSNLWIGFANSLAYGIFGAGLAVVLAGLAAYAIVTLRVRGGTLLFVLIYAGTALPFQMFIIPLSLSYQKVGLYDTHLGLIVFYTSICIPFSVFVFRAFLFSVPREVLEAAALDGASNFIIFSRMIVPMARNPLLLVFLTQFTWIFNDLLFGQTLAVSGSVRPIMVGIASISGQSAGAGSLPQGMSAALVASIPALVLFAAFRKRMMQGLFY